MKMISNKIASKIKYRCLIPLCVLLLFVVLFRLIQTDASKPSPQSQAPVLLSLVNTVTYLCRPECSRSFQIFFFRKSPTHFRQKKTPRIALTFDDGPNSKYTPLLLDGLRERKVHASFFLIGENIEGNEDILQQMRRDGHLIGNHTWDHVQLNKIPTQKARMEIEKTNNRIYEATGVYPSYVRPPFGAWLKDMELSVTMLPVFWDVDTLDWKSQNIGSILSYVRKRKLRDGSTHSHA